MSLWPRNSWGYIIFVGQASKNRHISFLLTGIVKKNGANLPDVCIIVSYVEQSLNVTSFMLFEDGFFSIGCKESQKPPSISWETQRRGLRPFSSAGSIVFFAAWVCKGKY
jgi:hypothetical protein